tara:strand:+ start:1036 stop:1749 length:714 start_codon:yes stop_codon:yes gene_type:complete
MFDINVDGTTFKIETPKPISSLQGMNRQLLTLSLHPSAPANILDGIINQVKNKIDDIKQLAEKNGFLIGSFAKINPTTGQCYSFKNYCAAVWGEPVEKDLQRNPQNYEWYPGHIGISEVKKGTQRYILISFYTVSISSRINNPVWLTVFFKSLLSGLLSIILFGFKSAFLIFIVLYVVGAYLIPFLEKKGYVNCKKDKDGKIIPGTCKPSTPATIIGGAFLGLIGLGLIMSLFGSRK